MRVCIVTCDRYRRTIDAERTILIAHSWPVDPQTRRPTLDLCPVCPTGLEDWRPPNLRFSRRVQIDGMPDMMYDLCMGADPEKQTLSLVIAHGDIRTPPLSHVARRWIGLKLRSVQEGESIVFPASRPMPSIGTRCHELRLTDNKAEWRVVYHIADKAVIVLDVFQKTTQKTPKHVIDQCKTRLAAYNQAIKGAADAKTRKGRGND